MPSFFTINTEHKSQRCQDPSSMECSTKDGQPSYKAERLEAGLQNSILSSPRVNSDEHGEITTELLPADRGDSEVSETANHDVLHQVQWMPVLFPSVADSFPPHFAETHPFLLIVIRTLQAALLAFGPLGWLQIMNPSFLMSLGCTVAGVVVGVVFLKQLTTYVLLKFTGKSGYKTSIVNCLHRHPRLSHFFSQNGSPFDLGEAMEVDEPGDKPEISLQEIIAYDLGTDSQRKVLKILTPALRTFKDLDSLPVILGRTIVIFVATILVDELAILLHLKPKSGHWYTGVIVGATFMKQVLAYLKPEFYSLWWFVVYFIDLTMISLLTYYITTWDYNPNL